MGGGLSGSSPFAFFSSCGFLTFHPPSILPFHVLSFQTSGVILVLDEFGLGKIKEWVNERLYDR